MSRLHITVDAVPEGIAAVSHVAANVRLREAGVPEDAISRVHTPIGTAISAVTPEEIAVSIAGEMICERALRREAAGASAHGCPMR